MIRKLSAALFAFGLLGAAPAPDWRPLDPENLLVIDTTKGRIIVEMAPDMAPQSVARVKLLAPLEMMLMFTTAAPALISTTVSFSLPG